MCTIRGLLASCVLVAPLLFTAPTLAQDAPKPASAQSPPSGSPTITLLDSGSGEKKSLRYTFAKGAESAFKMTTTMSTGMEMGGQKMPPQPVPPFVMTMQVRVQDVSPGGDATCDFTLVHADILDDPRVQKMIADAMRQSFKSLVGMKGTVVLNSRGIAKSFDMHLPAGADPMAQQQADQMQANFAQYCIPLPEQPVGNGAKWKLDQRISQGGINIDQTTTLTLTSVADNALELDFEVSQSAMNQQFESPQMPGMKINLSSLTSTGRGTMAGVLSSPFPTRSDASMKSETALSMPQLGDFKQQMEMTMKGETVPPLKTNANGTAADKPAAANARPAG